MSEIQALILVPLVSLTLIALFVAMGALFPKQIAEVKSKNMTVFFIYLGVDSHFSPMELERSTHGYNLW